MQHDSIRGTNPTNGSSVSSWHRCSLAPGGPKTEAMYFHIKVTRCSVHTAFWSPSNKLWHQDTHKHTHKRKINEKKKNMFSQNHLLQLQNDRATWSPATADAKRSPATAKRATWSWELELLVRDSNGIWFPPQKIIPPPKKKQQQQHDWLENSPAEWRCISY